MASREEQEYSTQAPAGYIGDFLKEGIFPYAQSFLKQQFGQLGGDDTSPFTYTGQRIADFDPREVRGMELTDQAIGSYLPFLGQQANLLSEATGTMRSAEDFTKRAGPDFSAARGGLGRAEFSGYGSTGMFDPSRQVSNFYNPFEEQVVQQTLDDISERFGKADIGLRDQAIGAGAFGGARSRLTQEELAEDAARGAAQQVGAIRSQGFDRATNAAQQAFEAQQRRQLGLAGLQGQLAAREGQFGSAEALASLRQGQQLGRLGQGLGALGQQYRGLATTLPALQGQDVSRLMAIGGLGRGKDQSGLDLDYQNFVGQYNLPMQTLQNVGALTASLGPLAGGYGYAGGAQPAAGSAFAPVTGSLPAIAGLPGSIGYNPPAVPSPAPAGGFSAGILGGLGGFNFGGLGGLGGFNPGAYYG